jgi:hypothetical protein
MPDLIPTAFSIDGDKTVPPQLSPQNFVSFEEGYTTDYELPLNTGNPNAKPVERTIQNYLFYVTTDNISFLQQHGYCIWYASMPGGYGINDKVVRQNNAGTWLPFRSLIAANISDPLVNSVNWEFDYSITAINAAIPMPSGGAIGASSSLITTATNLNSLPLGTFEIASDAIAASCANIPIALGSTAQAGMIETMQWSFNSVNYSIQRYVSRTGITANRGSINGSFSSWILAATSYGRSDGNITLSSSTVLTAIAGGNTIIWTGSTGTITLPVKSSLIANQFLWFNNNGSGAINIVTQGADVISSESGNITIFLLQPGDSLQLTALPSNNLYAAIGGTSLLQISKTLTSQPPFSDNSQRIATTSFVKQFTGNANGVYVFNNNTVLGQQHIGSLCILATGNYTITLPNVNLVPGGTIRFIFNGTGSVVINVAIASIVYPGISNTTFQTMVSGEERVYYSDGGTWYSALISHAATMGTGDNSTRIATTAFVQNNKPVVPSRFGGDPNMDGNADPGETGQWADGGHIHPSDTSKVDQTQLSNNIPLVDYGSGSPGGSNQIARIDHYHPSDTSKVPFSQYNNDFANGSNSNGYFQKFPGGHQYCISPQYTIQGTAHGSNSLTWTFPSAFVATPGIIIGLSGLTDGGSSVAFEYGIESVNTNSVNIFSAFQLSFYIMAMI